MAGGNCKEHPFVGTFRVNRCGVVVVDVVDRCVRTFGGNPSNIQGRKFVNERCKPQQWRIKPLDLPEKSTSMNSG